MDRSSSAHGLGELILEEGEMAQGHLTQALMLCREVGLSENVEFVEELLRNLPLTAAN